VFCCFETKRKKKIRVVSSWLKERYESVCERERECVCFVVMELEEAVTKSEIVERETVI
jgi:hypothetical protein